MWVLRIRSPSHPGSARATADNLSESFELLLLYMQVKEERKRGKLSFSYFLSLTGYAQPPNDCLQLRRAISLQAVFRFFAAFFFSYSACRLSSSFFVTAISALA